MTPILQAAAIAIVTLGTGAATLTAMNGEVQDLSVPDAPWEAGHLLDGRSFSFVGVTHEGSQVQTDILRFENGGFLSEDCEDYCNFGFTDYQTWVDGDVIHFTTNPTCSEAPHSVVWVGRVEGDRIYLDMSWTTRRWYWTQQIMGSGTGIDTATLGLPPGRLG